MLHKTRGSDEAGGGAFPELRTWLSTQGPSECGWSWVELGRETWSLLWELGLAGALGLSLRFSLVWLTFGGGKENKVGQT